jgi:hypothetical protein
MKAPFTSANLRKTRKVQSKQDQAKDKFHTQGEFHTFQTVKSKICCSKLKQIGITELKNTASKTYYVWCLIKSSLLETHGRIQMNTFM